MAENGLTERKFVFDSMETSPDLTQLPDKSSVVDLKYCAKPAKRWLLTIKQTRCYQIH